MVPGPAGSARRILLSETGRDGMWVSPQLSTVDDPGSGGQPRLLLDHAGQDWQTRDSQVFCLPTRCEPPVDAAGRLYLKRVTDVPSDQFPGAITELDELVRVDPATGTAETFGEARVLQVASDGGRFAYLHADADGKVHWIVVAPDGGRTTLSATDLEFVGDDLFYVDDDGTLWRWPPDGAAPVAVAEGVGHFQSFATERGPLLVLAPPWSPSMTTEAAPQPPSSLFDVTALAEMPLPSATASADTFLPSPSGRYLATGKLVLPATPADASGGYLSRRTLFDRDTGVEMKMESPTTTVGASTEWRPGHDELWFGIEHELWRWRVGEPPALVIQAVWSVPVLYRLISRQELFAFSSFTQDGRFWAEVGPDADLQQPMWLHWADDPTRPRVPLNPEGTGVSGAWPLADGRLLVEASVSENRRNYFHLIDPEAGTTRALPGLGNVVATGRDRFLALLNFVTVSSSGDLTLIDYASGTQTLIAENVYSVAVDTSPDPGDALAPGTRLVYLARNRIVSPYDGCWAVELP